MKKIVFILSLVIVAGLTVTVYANNIVVNNDSKITIVEDNNDKKPCPENCTAKCCAAKETKVEGTAETTECKEAKTEKKCCSSTQTSECTKSKGAEKPATTEKAPETKK